jgi:Immunity protein Imm1
MYDKSDAALGGLAFDGVFRREHVPVIKYQLSNGQEDEFPANWALPESDIMRALEYFVEHDGRRPPFIQWHDDGRDLKRRFDAPTTGGTRGFPPPGRKVGASHRQPIGSSGPPAQQHTGAAIRPAGADGRSEETSNRACGVRWEVFRLPARG